MVAIVIGIMYDGGVLFHLVAFKSVLPIHTVLKLCTFSIRYTIKVGRHQTLDSTYCPPFQHLIEIFHIKKDILRSIKFKYSCVSDKQEESARERALCQLTECF